MSDDGKNDPLPVKSRDKAEFDVRSLIDRLGDEIGTQPDSETVDKEFRDCVGKQGETADDGRFDMHYRAEMPLPRGEYDDALRKLKKKLKSGGYKITGYREGDWQEVLLYAKGGNDDFFVSVGGVKPPHEALTFAVTTPCFLPPGAEQEHVSAPELRASVGAAGTGAVAEPRAAFSASRQNVTLGDFG
jgi:hypothetical protein